MLSWLVYAQHNQHKPIYTHWGIVKQYVSSKRLGFVLPFLFNKWSVFFRTPSFFAQYLRHLLHHRLQPLHSSGQAQTMRSYMMINKYGLSGIVVLILYVQLQYTV